MQSEDRMECLSIEITDVLCVIIPCIFVDNTQYLQLFMTWHGGHS